MPRPSPVDAKTADLLQLIGAATRTDSLARGCGRTIVAGPSRPALLELLGELGAWEHRLASEAAGSTDPIAAAETRGAVHALALVVEAAAEAARDTAVPTNEVLLAELAAAPAAMLPSELADSLQMTRQAVTQALRRLTDKGLVRKHDGPKADGRTVPYELTPTGRRLAAVPA
jgi:DNA-binding transcriptional ArsR family regulator